MSRSLVVLVLAGAVAVQAGGEKKVDPPAEQAGAQAAGPAATAEPATAEPATAEPATTKPATVEPGVISDAELSLYPGSVFEVPTPAGATAEQSEPGEQARLPRDFQGSPPRIPHGIADFLPITREDNPCLVCHGVGAEDAPAVPASHLTDLRRKPESVGTELVAARAVCTSCHVTLSSARPIRDNGFRTP